MSWDDFLPSLSYVIVECSRPHILIEVEYMMELLEPSWLGGEGTVIFIPTCQSTPPPPPCIYIAYS